MYPYLGLLYRSWFITLVRNCGTKGLKFQVWLPAHSLKVKLRGYIIDGLDQYCKFIIVIRDVKCIEMYGRYPTLSSSAAIIWVWGSGDRPATGGHFLSDKDV